MVAARRDPEHAAEDAHRVLPSYLFEHRILRSDSLAKYAADFFKMSHSIRSSAFSRRRRESSASCSVTTWRRTPSPSSDRSPLLARLTQLSKVFGEMANRLDA